ncbi:VOC family protein [Promineifilum sp.]|uniref:VOC family protein n=1 Tax=Promineifilum sp. TaxID=2664178 RepID=UPI0035AFA590
MTQPFTITAVHHVTLTVSDVARSADFYTRHLGFQVLLDLGGTRRILGNGHVVLAVTLPSDQAAPIPAGDRFSENRVGLDHVSFGLSSRAELEAAAAYFDEQGIIRGEIRDLGPGLGIYVMAFRDPDNIQLEMTAPH